MLKVRVSGKDYQIEDSLKSKMNFFAKANNIEKIQADQVIEINTIQTATWEDLLKICALVKNEFPAVAKVKTNTLSDVIGHSLANYLNSKSYEELNELYRATQILEIQSFKRCIVACLAARVYVSRNLNDFKLRMSELKIKNEPSEDNVKEMREKYAFLH